MGDRSTRRLLAIGSLAAGVGAAIGIVMIARGRHQDVYPFAIASTVTTAVVTAARILAGDDPRSG